MAKALRKSERRALQRHYAAALIARGEDYRAKQLIRCVLEDERREQTGYRIWRCQMRNCLFCCGKYWRGFMYSYRRKIEKLIGAGYSLAFLTLTIPNTLLLNPGLFKWLAFNMKKLMRRQPFKDRMVGAVARIETDFNPDSQDFHVHIHIILIYSQCIPQHEIAEAWRDLNAPLLSDYALSDVPDRANNPCGVWIEKVEPQDLHQILKYVFKYEPFKDAEAFAEYDCAVRGIRLIQSYGELFERKRKARRR